MDQQLKQRLIGVTIAVALVVIFVPMLFEKSDDKDKIASGGIPPIPDDVLEKPLELPKTPEDLAPKEAEKPTAESGYRIVPFNEEVPTKPKESQENTANQQPEKAGEAPAAAWSEEEPPEPEPPVKKESPQILPAETPRPAPAKPHRTLQTEAAPNRPAEPRPASAPKKARASVARPEAVAEFADDDLEVKNAPAPAPQKPETPPVKPRPAAGQAAQKAEGINRPETPKPATAVRNATAKPQAKAPGAWVVQAGSFTEEALAQGLAERLRQARFAAFVETANGPHGPIYRVQIGPEQELRRAQEVLKQLGTSVGINGFIAPRR